MGHGNNQGVVYNQITMINSQIQSYRDLQVWQEGMNLAEACYQVTRAFPKEEI